MAFQNTLKDLSDLSDLSLTPLNVDKCPHASTSRSSRLSRLRTLVNIIALVWDTCKNLKVEEHIAQSRLKHFKKFFFFFLFRKDINFGRSAHI